MKRSASIVLIILFSLFAAQVSHAQLGGLVKRAKKTAEQTVEKKANEEVDKQVAALVSGLWDDVADNFKGMVMSMAGDSKTVVDLDNNVIHQQGGSDIPIRDNADSPVDAEFVRFNNVAMIIYPSEMNESMTNLMGNGSVEEVFVHNGRKKHQNLISGEITDADAGMLEAFDHKQREFWRLDYKWMMESAGEAFDKLNATMAEAQAQSGNSDQSMSDMQMMTIESESTVETRLGDRRKIRGLDAQQHIIIVTITPTDPEVAREQGVFYSVIDLWMAEEFGGSATIADYDKRLGESMMESIETSGVDGPSLNFSVFGDPRLDEGTEAALDYEFGLAGTPIDKTGYYVKGPYGAKLDLEAVLNNTGPTEVRSFSGTSYEGPVEVQSTMFTVRQFVSNVSTEPFDLEMLQVPAGYTEVESPMKKFLDGDYDAAIDKGVEGAGDGN